MAQELPESEERFRLLVEQAGIGVGYYSLDGTILFFNRQALRELGGEAEDYVGKSMREVFGESQAAEWMSRFRAVAAGPQPRDYEDRVTLATGRKWFLSNYARMVNASGEVIGVQVVSQDISERKRMEEALQASEHCHRGLFEAAGMGLAVHEILCNDRGEPCDYRFLEVDPAFERMTGLKREKLLGRRQSEVLPNEGPEWIRLFGQVALTGKPVRFQKHSVTKEKYFEGVAYCPAPGQFAGLFIDITQRKLAEDRAALAADVLGLLNRPSDLDRTIGDILRLVKNRLGFDAVGIRLRQGNDFPYLVQNGFSSHFVRKESRLCRYDKAGRPVLDAAGSPVLECMGGNILTGRTDPRKPFFTKGGSFWTNSTTDLLAATSRKDRQGRTRNRCNTEGYESVALIPLRSDDEIVGLLQLNDRRRGQLSIDLVRFLEDLSASIGIAIQRQRAMESLQTSEDKYARLFNSMMDAFALVGLDGRFLETNRTYRDLVGYSQEELSRLTYRDLTPEKWHARDAEIVETQVLARGHSQVYEKEYRRKDGTVFPIELRCYLLRDPAGLPAGMWAIVRDITAHRKLQEQFVRAQRMEAIGQLAGGVAHDFRNQLAVIKGYGEMLLRRSLVKRDGVEKVREILNAANRSVTISGHLLAFSRQQVLRPEVVKVDSAIGDLMKSLTQTIGEDIRLSILSSGDLWNVHVDIGQFQQALLNLVLNARDAMPKGGRLTIEARNIVVDEEFVRAHADASSGRHVVLSVRDTGVGMPPETLRRLFEPFFTTKPVGEGTGLGLAMVYGFVGQSGGFIDVESQPGRGTTFRLYFPSVDGVAEPARPPSQETDLPQGAGTILVVEDEEAIRRILLETLGECGYRVLTAGNAREALALAKPAKRKIDLLITDVVMPGLSGPELANQFRKVRPGVPVLLISGHTGRMLTGHGATSSDVNLLVKPFSSQTLAERVRTVMGHSGRPPATVPRRKRGLPSAK